MEEQDIRVNYNYIKDVEFGIVNVSTSADLIEFSEDYDEKISPLGSSRMYLFNPELFNDWTGMLLESDGVSGDLYTVVEGLEDYYRKGDITGLVLVIDDFEIKEHLRGKGLGLKSLKKVLKDLPFMGIDLVGLIPGFYGKSPEGNTQRNNKIQFFYKKCGFEIVNPKASMPVMGKYLHLRD